MKRITILFPQQYSNFKRCGIVGAVEVFNKADDYWKQQGNRQKYKLLIAGRSSC